MIVELLIITALALVIGGLIGFMLGFKYSLWEMEDYVLIHKDKCTEVQPCATCEAHEEAGYAEYQHEMDQYAEDIELQSAMHDYHDEHGNKIEG